MKSFGERLRHERERLGFSQLAFGEIGGVQRRAQINYEANERHPDSQYLSAIASAGADVLYILTGQRSSLAESTLNASERDLLDNYRHTQPKQQKLIEEFAVMAAESQQAKAAA